MASDSEEVSDFNLRNYHVYPNFYSFVGAKKSIDDEKDWRKRR